jgi:hypothetical protein
LHRFHSLQLTTTQQTLRKCAYRVRLQSGNEMYVEQLH